MSVRQRAVDLLYAMCDRSNAEEIVSEMLSYLETADYSIREEMVSYEQTADRDSWTDFERVFLGVEEFFQLFLSGTKSSHTGRKICRRLHVVCGHHIKPYQDSW